MHLGRVLYIRKIVRKYLNFKNICHTKKLLKVKFVFTDNNINCMEFFQFKVILFNWFV